MCFSVKCCPFNQIRNEKLLEHRNIPEVDKEQTKVARKKEGERESAKVEERLVVHPGNDDHPDGKGGQVDASLPMELL